MNGRVLIIAFAFSSAALANYSSQIAKRLDVNATSMTVTNSGTGSWTETIQFAPVLGGRVRVSISVNDVPPPAGTTYTDCADPCSVSMNMNWGEMTVTKELLDGSGNPYSPPKIATHIIAQVMIPCIAAGSWKLPIEVVGQQRYKTCVQFSATSSPSSNLRLHMRLFNHGYQQIVCDSANYCDWSTKLAVQICQGADRTGTCTAWLQVNNTNTTAEDSCKWYTFDFAHCIAGVWQAVEVYRDLPNSALTNGTNNITFRFNGTDGVTSGVRVLEWAILDSSTRKSMTQIAVSSNVATPTTSSAHGLVSGDDAFIEQAPGMRGRFKGLRHLTAGSGSTFSFIPCGSGSGFYVIPGGCTSPNGTYKVPISYASGNTLVYYPQTAQQAMYVTKVVAPTISTLLYDDPSTWTAGSGNASNGHALFTTATLVTPHNPQLPIPNVNHVDVHCSSCHTDDTPWGGQAGMDLKYFAFSNWSIKQRAIFHGFTESQADDVVAYIRGITATVPAMARPWNPVQFPGPGLDALALVNWDAGTGLDAQLTYDCDTAEYITGVAGCTTGQAGGDFTKFDISQKVNLRELPMPHQAQPIHTWWPTVHPKDAFPAVDFFASTAYAHYQSFVTAVTAQTAGSYTGSHALADWLQQTFLWQSSALTPTYRPIASEVAGYWRPDTNLNIFSLAQWSWIKLFEVMHPTLEGYCSEYYTTALGYGARPSGSYDSRCWTQQRFVFNPTFHIATDQTHHTAFLDSFRYAKPTGQPGCCNDATNHTQTNVQYLMSAVNACNYHEVGQVTRDIGYYHGYASEGGKLSVGIWYSSLIPFLSSAQCGVDYGVSGGTDNSSNLLRSFANYSIDYDAYLNWTWTSPADQATIMTKMASFLLTVGNKYTVSAWRTYLTALPDTITPSGMFQAWAGGTISVGNWLAMFLPVAKYFGADNTTLSNLADWGNTVVSGSVWVGHDFQTDLAASCVNTDVSSGGAILFWPKCSNVP